MHPADGLIAQLAGRQSGVVTRVQLLAVGISRPMIRHRLNVGRLHAIHRGVYAVGHLALAPHARELAAVLACGPRSAASHQSAAGLWDFAQRPRGPVEVVREGSHGLGAAGVRVHETTSLPLSEIRHRYGVRVTSPARTLLDLAATINASELERAVGEAQARGLVRNGELEALARSGRRGCVALGAILEDPPSLTRSEAERHLLALLARARLPKPHTNVRVGSYEVDAFWPAQRLVVEVDGYAFHSGRAAFERDRLRDADLQSTGLGVMRVTWRQLVRQPEVVVARLGAALSRRP